MYEPVVREYILLGLRLGRLVDGLVDCWFGDEALHRLVSAEPAPIPAELAADAARVRAMLPDSGLDPARAAFLDAQARALHCSARVLDDVPVPFRAEVRAYFDVDIEAGDPDRFAPIHEQIAELLPGSGPLGERIAAHAERDRIPPGGLRAAAEALSAELREATQAEFRPPQTEAVHYEAVTDEPWNAFNRYHGGFRSTVSLNEDVGHGMSALPHLVTHEAYPGHHTERCVKEAELVRRGHGEQSISLINTPQCLLAEGMGEVALSVLPGPGWGPWTAGVLAAQGLHLDGEFVERLLPLTSQLLQARLDAAIMLHDRHIETEDVVGYLRRAMLVPEQRARHMIRFLADPLWRSYTVTYIEGARLVRTWLAARPAGQPIARRYARLLAEPLLPATLRAELSSPNGGDHDVPERVPGVRAGAGTVPTGRTGRDHQLPG